MIVFCEDCGARNPVTPSQFIRGRVRFSCKSCGYENAYAMEPGTEHDPEAEDDSRIVPEEAQAIRSILERAFKHPGVERLWAVNGGRCLTLVSTSVHDSSGEADTRYAREMIDLLSKALTVFSDTEHVTMAWGRTVFTSFRLSGNFFLVVRSRSFPETDGLPRVILECRSCLAAALKNGRSPDKDGTP